MVIYGNIKTNSNIMNDKIEYVNGFLFSPDYKKIVLIRKNRPSFQIGETPLDAMKREFMEEAGIEINNWHNFSKMEGNEWVVYMYLAKSEDYIKTFSKTDEEVEIHYVFDIANLDLIPNLKWLIPMSIDMDNIYTNITYL